ncbi:general odorant-binding protein 28a-like [Anastrepha obliqua]|uniref:general odorant-binding protein 28a-like n=1 Tax=Anastrepha obliqua TaxID=95512 RepID=UPI00240960B6|nr:general odorant-binding protein 28a-like [Anastrepha obliqua]
MAKLILIAIFCVLSGTLSEAFNREEAIKKFMTRLGECRQEVGAAPSDIEELIKKLPAAGKEGKCLRACMMKKYGVMNDDGKFIKAVALEHAATYSDGDETKMKTANEIIDACGGTAVPDDPCEAAAVYSHCFIEQAIAHGLEKFEF